MATIHYLNVKDGDCSIIEHNSGRTTVVDVSNAKSVNISQETLTALQADRAAKSAVQGNFNQKAYPVNPISYMQDRGINSIFRFILTNPDMDHMDGLKIFFETFSPGNFWDTDNTAEKDFANPCSYNEEDWKFYKEIRDGKPTSNPKRLVLTPGSTGQYYNIGENGESGDGLHILAPTEQMVCDANDACNCNDCSYVILYLTADHKILFAGDSHDVTWEYILGNHKDSVSNVDLLMAPHHGRHSDRSFDFLETVRPKMTFFGNAPSEHLAYDQYRKYGTVITNNQANCMIVNASATPMDLYVTNEMFAKAANPWTFYSDTYKGWYYGPIK